MEDHYVKALEALKLQAKALSGDDNFTIDQELLHRAQQEMAQYEPYTTHVSNRIMELKESKITIDTADVAWLKQEFGQ